MDKASVSPRGVSSLPPSGLYLGKTSHVGRAGRATQSFLITAGSNLLLPDESAKPLSESARRSSGKSLNVATFAWKLRGKGQALLSSGSSRIISSERHLQPASSRLSAWVLLPEPRGTHQQESSIVLDETLRRAAAGNGSGPPEAQAG